MNALLNPPQVVEPETEDYLMSMDDVTFESYAQAKRSELEGGFKVTKVSSGHHKGGMLQSLSTGNMLSFTAPKRDKTASPQLSPRSRSSRSQGSSPVNSPPRSRDASPNPPKIKLPERPVSPSRRGIPEIPEIAPLDPEFERNVFKSSIASQKAAQVLGATDAVVEMTMENPHIEKEEDKNLFETTTNYSKAAKILGESEILDEEEKRKLKLAQRLGEAKALAIDQKDATPKELDPQVESLILINTVTSSKALNFLGEQETVTELNMRPHLEKAEEKQVLHFKVGNINKAAKVLGETDMLGGDDRRAFRVAKMLGDTDATQLDAKKTKRSSFHATIDKEVEQLMLTSTLNSSKAAQLLGESETMINQTVNQRHLQPEVENSILHSKHQIPKAARVLGETQFLTTEEKKDYKVLKQLGNTELLDRKTAQKDEVDFEVQSLLLKSQVPSNSKAAKLLGHGTP